MNRKLLTLRRQGAKIVPKATWGRSGLRGSTTRMAETECFVRCEVHSLRRWMLPKNEMALRLQFTAPEGGRTPKPYGLRLRRGLRSPSTALPSGMAIPNKYAHAA